MSLTIVSNHGLSTTSHTRAIQQLNALSLNTEGYNSLIREFFPSAPELNDLELSQYLAGYVIQEAILEQRIEPFGESHYKSLLDRAMRLQAKSYNGALYRDGVVTVMNDEGELVQIQREVKGTTLAPKTSRRRRSAGGKSAQDLAQDLFTANPKLARQEMMDLMVEKLQISRNTASTYFAKFNKDAKRETGGKKGRQSGVSREDQVREVFSSKETWKDRAELVTAIVEAVGCSRASANTFSYKVMPSTRGQK